MANHDQLREEAKLIIPIDFDRHPEQWASQQPTHVLIQWLSKNWSLFAGRLALKAVQDEIDFRIPKRKP